MKSKILLAILFSGGMFSEAYAQGPPGGAMPPPQVTLVTVESRTVPVTYEYVGMTQPSKTVEVRARVQGFLESRDFQEGTYLEEGTGLFTIDPRSFEADREVAAAQVEQAKARLNLAEQEVKRLQSVTQPGAITQSDLDQKIAERQGAGAALRLAKAQLAKADLELSYTKVDAPLTGYVGKALKETGSLVDAGQNSLLTVMQQVDPLYVSFKVSETDFLTWKHDEKEGRLKRINGGENMEVEITLLDGTPFPDKGILDFENIDLDPRTGTVELRATLENAERTLKPGQFVKVLLNGWERPGSLVVPQRAVGQSPQGAYVYVVGAENKVEMRPVTTGAWSGQDWVILDGLKEGERVITDGLTKVRPGVEVTVEGQGDAPGGSGGDGPPPDAASSQS